MRCAFGVVGSVLVAASFAVLLAASSSAMAQEQGREAITGAFGYDLGAAYVPDADAEMIQERGGLVRVDVSPQIPTGFFLYHALWLEPESQTIVQITATAPHPTRDSAEAALQSLLDILENKYGQGTYEDLVHTFRHGRRSIHVGVSQQGSVYVLAIAYQDDELVSRAMEEAARRRFTPPRTDDGGL
ncbi:hypothetical protein DPQ33_01345 [Oceanidesulfovibrio indonesiensis]|uniref:Uncharacterized protein n=1 Tax=Oceanidesulfovibrio indonesiensis TaxID=54767 RepID=A0A7M3MKF0_9BACT|nr:hypothetical protein [Oceanidesulfovibrio indonesiensis]TVM19901.1 hypothetical protein DPQ33_01345 [Oceanidesulfovibrio indonesiensis]